MTFSVYSADALRQLPPLARFRESPDFDALVAKGIETTGWDVRLFTSFDLETYKTTASNLTPRMVCGSVATLKDGGLLLSRDDAFDVFEAIISSDDLIIVGAHISYDLAVLANERPQWMPRIIELFKKNRIFDILLAQALDAIAGGHLGLNYDLSDMRKPSTGEIAKRYSLEVVVHQVLGRADAKDNDEWRLRYGELDGVPISQYPPKAAQYPVDDTVNTLEAAVAQVTGWGKTRQPNMGPHRNLRDLSEQCRAAFAEWLAAVQGLPVDQAAVDEYENEVLAKRREGIKKAFTEGLLRLNGSRKATLEIAGEDFYKQLKKEEAKAEEEGRAPRHEIPDDVYDRLEAEAKRAKEAEKTARVKLSKDTKKIKRRVLEAMGAGSCRGGDAPPAPVPGDDLRHVSMYLKAPVDCAICGRPLEDPESLARGVGPACEKRFLVPTQNALWDITRLRGGWVGERCAVAYPDWGIDSKGVVLELLKLISVRPDVEDVVGAVEVIRQLGYPALVEQLTDGKGSLARLALRDAEALKDHAEKVLAHRERVARHGQGDFKDCPSCLGTGMEVPEGLELTDGGDISIGRAVLEDLEAPDLAALAQVGKSDKAVTTYIPYLRKAEPTVHPRPNVLLATGRSSYDGPIQQMPRTGRERACFVAPAGYSIISIDYAGIECVTWAQACLWLVGRSAMAEAIIAGKDIHSDLASDLMDNRLGWEEIKKLAKADAASEAGRMRQASKPANFGYPGGMGALKFVITQRKAGIILCKYFGFAECRRILVEEKHTGRKVSVCGHCLDVAINLKKKWMGKWPEARDYFARITEIVEASGEIPTLVPEWISASGVARMRGGVDFCAACNNLFQSLAAVGAKRALWRLTEECWTFKNPFLIGVTPRLFIHDEFLFLAPDEIAEVAAVEAGRIMVEEMQLVVPDVAVGVKTEHKISKNWKK